MIFNFVTAASVGPFFRALMMSTVWLAKIESRIEQKTLLLGLIRVKQGTLAWLLGIKSTQNLVKSNFKKFYESQACKQTLSILALPCLSRLAPETTIKMHPNSRSSFTWNTTNTTVKAPDIIDAIAIKHHNKLWMPPLTIRLTWFLVPCRPKHRFCPLLSLRWGLWQSWRQRNCSAFPSKETLIHFCSASFLPVSPAWTWQSVLLMVLQNFRSYLASMHTVSAAFRGWRVFFWQWQSGHQTCWYISKSWQGKFLIFNLQILMSLNSVRDRCKSILTSCWCNIAKVTIYSK